MDSLNFLHLSTFYPPYSFGGDAMYVYRLCHALADAGHHVDVLHCMDSYNLLHPSPPPILFPEHPAVVRHELRSRYGVVSPFLTQQTGHPLLKTAAIRRVLDSRRYDVVHFHNMSLIGPHAMRLDSVHGPAVKLYTTHEHWLICPMHVLWKFDKMACDKPDCLRCTLHGKRPPQLWRYTNLLDKCARHVDQFVSPSRFTARMHAERGFQPKIEHLPYFVDRSDADWRTPAPRPQERPYFLFVGRLETIKGLHTLFPIWDRLDGYDLLVVGTGTAEGALKSMAGSRPAIKFLGPRPQKELGALYHHALATVVPSITYETFGMISAESFARKTPVIVRDLGALPEAVEDSGGGFVYRTDDELVAALQKVASSPRLREELGQRGYDGFLRQWSKEAHFSFYFDFIDRAAQRKFGCPLQHRKPEKLQAAGANV